MHAPNIVNVATITGVTTYHSGIAATTGGKGSVGITTVVSNAASSGKVLKINSLTAAGIAATTGITLQHFNHVNHASAGSTVSIAMTVSVPIFSSLVVIKRKCYISGRKYFTRNLLTTKHWWNYRRSLFIRRNHRGG